MDVSRNQITFAFPTITVYTYYNMCTIFNSCSMSAHLIWVGYTNLVSNKSETGANEIIEEIRFFTLFNSQSLFKLKPLEVSVTSDRRNGKT